MMLGYLRGEILDHADGKLLVGVQTGTNGSSVGYLVNIPQSPAYVGFVPGKVVELFLHTHVREDALDLYGFASKVEKEIFLTLLGVTGIGPKGAIGILSKIEPSQLIQAILDGDKDSLVQIPGIGKKTAERVVLELGDTVRKKITAGSLGDAARTVTVGKRSEPELQVVGAKKVSSVILQESKAALLGLGYREQEVTALLNEVFSKSDQEFTRTEDVIKSALRHMV
jgi:Holliday junction DNA helicase RuvA